MLWMMRTLWMSLVQFRSRCVTIVKAGLSQPWSNYKIAARLSQSPDCPLHSVCTQSGVLRYIRPAYHFTKRYMYFL
ncbi:hypothetical protein BDZ97DRAFT_738166 [Flammula alnicola]|nr:hypothetical protein BDZ97DRAFT_738166 [Flammula alnicola]